MSIMSFVGSHRVIGLPHAIVWVATIVEMRMCVVTRASVSFIAVKSVANDIQLRMLQGANHGLKIGVMMLFILLEFQNKKRKEG